MTISPYQVGAIIHPSADADKDETLAFFSNVTDSPFEVKAGKKLVRGMIIKIEPMEWTELDPLRSGETGKYHYTDISGKEVEI